ncbi:MAG: hypothetical protein HY322_05220 [Betaproteobacteria bacterium]|nr:hypothetical protein [Betaproteobacteria bacterium]
MSDEPTVQGEECRLTDQPFSAMTFGQRLNFIGKALVFFVSGGFIFPTMWID